MLRARLMAALYEGREGEARMKSLNLCTSKGDAVCVAAQAGEILIMAQRDVEQEAPRAGPRPMRVGSLNPFVKLTAAEAREIAAKLTEAAETQDAA